MFLRWIDDLAAVTTDRQIGDSVTISPTRETYRLLMDADMTNVDFVELLFQRMMRSVDRDVSPAVDDFHRVMHANIASGRLDRAETYLQSLVQLHRSNFCSESMYQPTARTYNLLIAGYAKTSRPHDSNRVLQQLLDDGFVEIPPPAYCFETCLNAWSSVSHKSAGHRIECLVLQMQQLGVAVTPRSFVKLIAAWTQSRRANAPQRARAILRLLLSVVDEELAKKTVLSNNDEMIDGPDRSVERAVLDAYLHVVRAFALTASRDRTAPDQCHALLKELLSSGRVAALQDATGSDSAAHRGTFRKICSMVCLAWARSKRRDAAQQIERLLHQLETDFGLPADRFCCNTLLEAHASQGDRKGALQTWNRFFESTGGKPALEPDVQSVNSVLLALDRSRDSWERSEAESFWDRVRSQFRVDPNVVTFNALLSLAGKSDKLEIARRGEAYLAQLELLHSNGDPACRPNPVTYAKAIELWENIRDHPEEATQRVQAHWATMKRKRMRPTEAACRAYAIVFQSNGESRVC
jgi:pentatricopeptide repeat protein